MKTHLVAFLVFSLTLGCANRTSPYVVGGVYSTGPVGGIPLYGLHKVLATGPDELFVYQTIETFSTPPTLSQFPTNENVLPGLQYFTISVQEFERRRPVLIGKLPLSAAEAAAAANK